jgi:hypothetical protein
MINNPLDISMGPSLYSHGKSCLYSARRLIDSVRSIVSTCALFVIFTLSLIGWGDPCLHGAVLDGFVPKWSNFK